MSCRLLLFMAVFWVLASVWSCPASAGQPSNKPVVLLGDEWCPYNCDPASDHPGYAVEVARAVFDASRRSLEYREMTWTRSMAEVAAGHADGLIGLTRREDSAFIFPREPIGISALGMAVSSASAFRYDGPASLSRRVLGVVASYAFGGPCGDYIRAHQADRDLVQKVSGTDAVTKNVYKLQAGRLDIVVDDANVLADALAALGPHSGLKLAARTNAEPVYIAFSPALPRSRELAGILDAGLERLRASGRLAAILARYNLRDWK